MILFISYSHLDRPQVETLVVQLGVLDHTVQFEQKMLASHIQWATIFDGIRQSDIFVFAVSPHALASHSRSLEYQYAVALGKPIIWVLLRDTNLEAYTPPILIDYRNPTPNADVALADALNALSSTPLPSPLPEPPEWAAALSGLREQVVAPHLSLNEQTDVLLNLQEFLERRETRAIAESLLEVFQTRRDLSTAIRKDIDATILSIGQTHVLRRRLHVRNTAVIGTVVLLAAMVVFVLMNRSASSSRIEMQNMASVTVSSTSDPRLELALVNTALYGAVLTEPFTPSQTSTPPPTQTPNPPTTTPIPPTATLNPPTATLIPLTLTFTATRIPPTETAVPPTSTPLPTATRILPSPTPIPPTNTPLPTIPTLMPPTATRIPPTSTPLPTLTRIPPTPTLLPPTVTRIPPTPTPIPPTFTPSPTLTPTASPTIDLNSILPDTVYVGLTVVDTPNGIVVTNAGQTALTAGVQVGDIVLAVDLVEVSTVEAFLREMNARNPFARVSLRLRRGGIVIIPITLGVSDYAVPTPTAS